MAALKVLISSIFWYMTSKMCGFRFKTAAFFVCICRSVQARNFYDKAFDRAWKDKSFGIFKNVLRQRIREIQLFFAEQPFFLKISHYISISGDDSSSFHTLHENRLGRYFRNKFSTPLSGSFGFFSPKHVLIMSKISRRCFPVRSACSFLLPTRWIP